MPKRSNEFQKLIYLVKQQITEDASVSESKLLIDRITGTKREVDICIEQTIAGHPVVISFECRDYKRKASVQWVEEMKTKHERLATNALVLVSRRGFTSEAVEVAEAYGIETLALDEVDEDSINRLFGKLSSMWAKTFTLSPTKVVIRVEEMDNMPAENVAVLPDNIIFKTDGTPLGKVKELVELMLRSEYIGREMGARGDQTHTGFILHWDDPRDREGDPICLQKEQPLMLRRIEYIRVTGEVEFIISEFPLEHGVVGNIRISWGSSKFLGKDALLVASENETGEKKISIKVSGPDLETSD